MKVIAKIDDDKVLCEVSAMEIAKLYDTSITSTYSKEFKRAWLEVGSVHDLTAAFKTLESLRNFDQRQLVYVKDRIDNMTTEYEKLLESYEKLMLFDTLKEIKNEDS